MNTIQIRKKVNSILVDYRTTVRQCKAEQESLRDAEDYLANVKEAQIIVQQVAQTIQQKAHNKIAGVVTKCLQTVFVGDDTYELKIHFERKRGKTEAKIVLVKNGHEIIKPLKNDSGGVVDVAAFVLRLTCLVLSKPYLRRLIALDEPFKFVDAINLENVCSMLEELAVNFDCQFIIITHIDQLKIGKVIRL